MLQGSASDPGLQAQRHMRGRVGRCADDFVTVDRTDQSGNWQSYLQLSKRAPVGQVNLKPTYVSRVLAFRVARENSSPRREVVSIAAPTSYVLEEENYDQKGGLNPKAKGKHNAIESSVNLLGTSPWPWALMQMKAFSCLCLTHTLSHCLCGAPPALLSYNLLVQDSGLGI